MTAPTATTSATGEKQRRASPDGAVRPFNVETSDDTLVDLHRRVAATRWPSKELVDDR